MTKKAILKVAAQFDSFPAASIVRRATGAPSGSPEFEAGRRAFHALVRSGRIVKVFGEPGSRKSLYSLNEEMPR